MAKCGVLFLNRGRWGDGHMFSAPWVNTAADVHHQGTSRCDPGELVSNCYLWWLAVAGETDLFVAAGWGRQFVIYVLTLDLVVAANAAWQVDSNTADAQERAIAELVFERLRPLIPVRHRSLRWPGGRVLPSPGSIFGASAFDLARLIAIDR